MGYVHHCVFCGWRRNAQSRTALSPACPTCGGTLVSSLDRDYEREQRMLAADADGPVSRSPTALARWGRWVLGTVILIAAVKAGHENGGLGIAIAALGLAVMALTPVLLPRRQGFAQREVAEQRARRTTTIVAG
jgi:hypothetical protein